MECYLLEATALSGDYKCCPRSPKELDMVSPGSEDPLQSCAELDVVSPGSGDPL